MQESMFRGDLLGKQTVHA